MHHFFLLCHFKQNSEALINNLREQHQTYIAGHTKWISYGGLISEVGKPAKGIVVFLKNLNKSQAEEFVKNDPYFPVYERFEIKDFELKIANGDQKTF